MNDKTSNILSALFVATILVLTAIGNAYLMMLAGVVGLAVGLVFMKGKIGTAGFLAAITGCAVAIAIALFILLK